MFNKKKNRIIELEKKNEKLRNLILFRSNTNREEIFYYQPKNITKQYFSCDIEGNVVENISKEGLDFRVKLALSNGIAEYLMDEIESYKTEILPNGDSRFSISVYVMIE